MAKRTASGCDQIFCTFVNRNVATLAHIINAVNAPGNRELMLAQSLVFEAAKRSKANAKAPNEITLHTVQYAEDRAIIPSSFTPLPDLQRSVQDLGTFSDKRKLPLIRDILGCAYTNTTADYFIISNSDIIPMPFFYDAVQQIIAEGYDAFIINRRRISKKFDSMEQLETMYSEAGKDHTGYDCFVIKRELFPKFILADVCIGIPHAWNDLAHNLFCFPDKFKLFTRKHLTFHIGMELHKTWGSSDLLAHNTTEFLKVVTALQPHYKIEFIPGSNLPFFKRHFKWLMNYTLHYPSMAKTDFRQWSRPRPPRENVNEAENGVNRYLNFLIKWINFD